MLESWNDGLKETSIHSVFDVIDFLVLMAYFFAETARRLSLESVIKKSKFKISCRIVRFPRIIPNIPTFHYSNIPYGSN